MDSSWFFSRKGKNQFYSIAVQIKLLLDMPEKVVMVTIIMPLNYALMFQQIWLALEDCSFLQASQLFLLARHVNTSLQSDSQQAAKIATYFPVLARQWAAIGHFRTTILQTCRERLHDVGVSNQVTGFDNYICSIIANFLLMSGDCWMLMLHPTPGRQQTARSIQRILSSKNSE